MCSQIQTELGGDVRRQNFSLTRELDGDLKLIEGHQWRRSLLR